MAKEKKTVVVGKRLPTDKIKKLERLGVDIPTAIEDLVNKILNEKKCPCCGKDLK